MIWKYGCLYLEVVNFKKKKIMNCEVKIKIVLYYMIMIIYNEFYLYV